MVRAKWAVDIEELRRARLTKRNRKDKERRAKSDAEMEEQRRVKSDAGMENRGEQVILRRIKQEVEQILLQKWRNRGDKGTLK